MERATSDYVMGRASLEDIWELLESGDGESHIGTEKLRSALLGAFLFFSMVYNPKRKKVPSAKQAEPYVDKLFGYVARKVGGFRNYMIFMSAGAGRTCVAGLEGVVYMYFNSTCIVIGGQGWRRQDIKGGFR
eukprot:1350318-Amorphochlora_amoeboformis.AAC.2